MTGNGDRKRSPERESKAELDKDLNEALKATFPATDPFMVGEPTGRKGPVPPGAPVPRPKKAADKPVPAAKGKSARRG